MKESKALREMQRGSEEALGWFIDRYSGYVTTIIYNIIGACMDSGDVEEVASDVFLAFWQNAKKVRSRSVKAYLGAIARNRAKNKLRECGYDLPLEEQILLVDGISPETEFQRRELARVVQRAVLALPQPDREIFLRFYYYSQCTEQIAGEMGINHSTVRSKLRRGRQSLKETLVTYLT